MLKPKGKRRSSGARLAKRLEIAVRNYSKPSLGMTSIVLILRHATVFGIYTFSESALLLKDEFGVERHVSSAGKDFRHPKYVSRLLLGYGRGNNNPGRVLTPSEEVQ